MLRMEQGHTYASVGDSHRGGFKIGARFAHLQQSRHASLSVGDVEPAYPECLKSALGTVPVCHSWLQVQ